MRASLYVKRLFLLDQRSDAIECTRSAGKRYFVLHCRCAFLYRVDCIRIENKRPTSVQRVSASNAISLAFWKKEKQLVLPGYTIRLDVIRTLYTNEAVNLQHPKTTTLLTNRRSVARRFGKKLYNFLFSRKIIKTLVLRL